jgi:hypothetical protein
MVSVLFFVRGKEWNVFFAMLCQEMRLVSLYELLLSRLVGLSDGASGSGFCSWL